MRLLASSYRFAICALLAGIPAVAGCTVGDGSESVGTDKAAKIVGTNDLTPVVQDGANIPAKYGPLVDAFGLIAFENGSNHCTATHIGNGIAVTAGHCFHAPAARKDNFACPGYTIDWGYRKDKAAYLTSSCVKVIAAETNSTRDYAFFLLDSVPHAAVKPSLATTRPAVSTALTIFSHPYHRPLEWSQVCTLQPASNGGYGADQFSHQCDTEPGSSGATILDDASLTVVGIHDGGSLPWNYGTFLSDTPVAEVTAPPAPPPAAPPPATAIAIETANLP